MPVETEELDEQAEINFWRHEQFRQLGFDVKAANVLTRGEADHHEAERLLKHGCSHELVVAILS